MDVQRRRARQYAVCTYAVRYDRVTDGAEGVFDQALTNGLAAIVAYEWPRAELNDRGRMLAASQLLAVIEQRGKHAEEGTIRILRDGEPEWVESTIDGELAPNFTSVDAPTLRDALRATQRVRHARDEGDQSGPLLAEQHIKALEELDYHPALFAVTDEQIDRAEVGIADADAAERRRAAEYWNALGPDERTRRVAIDYNDLYAWETKDGRCEVEVCPVCLTVALVADDFDSYLDAIGIGSCIACSYHRSRDVADDEAMMSELRRQVERDD
jgi:hypothetical protein